MLSIVTK